MKQAISQGELKNFTLDSSKPTKALLNLANVWNTIRYSYHVKQWGLTLLFNLESELPQFLLLILSLNYLLQIVPLLICKLIK